MKNYQFFIICWILANICSNLEKTKEMEGQWGAISMIFSCIALWSFLPTVKVSKEDKED